jgi:hypothetical protein
MQQSVAESSMIAGYHMSAELGSSKRFEAFRVATAPQASAFGTLYLMHDVLVRTDVFVETVKAIRAAWPFEVPVDRAWVLPDAQLWNDRPWIVVPDTLMVLASKERLSRAALASLGAQLAWLQDFRAPAELTGAFAHGDVRANRIALVGGSPFLIAPGWVAACELALERSLAHTRADDAYHMAKLLVQKRESTRPVEARTLRPSRGAEEHGAGADATRGLREPGAPGGVVKPSPLGAAPPSSRATPKAPSVAGRSPAAPKPVDARSPFAAPTPKPAPVAARPPAVPKPVDARSPFAAPTPTPAAVQARSPGGPVRPAARDAAPLRPVSSGEPERLQAAAVSPPVPLITPQRELGGSEQRVEPTSVAPAAPAISRYSAADDEDSELELHAPESDPPPSLPIIEARPLASRHAPEQAPGLAGDATVSNVPALSPAPSRLPWIIAAVLLALVIAAVLVFLARR